MRTPPKHLKPTKRNQRRTEKAILAAQKAKQKYARELEKYEKKAAKLEESAKKESEKVIRGASSAAVPTPAPVQKPAPAPVQKPTPAPVQKPAPAPVQKPAPVPVVEIEEYEEEEKRRGGAFFTVAGIVFLLIAVLVTLWEFGVFDKLLAKPVDADTSAPAGISEQLPDETTAQTEV